jgi:uncharacterized protein (TIGR03083 family)
VCFARAVDAVEQWSLAQERVIALVRDIPGEQVARHVPACPDWTVRDLLSHMVGLGADVAAGDEPDDHNAAWTQRQVDARAGRDIPALVTEWRTVAGPLTAWMRARGPRPLADILIHEQDLRGALGVSGAQDTPGLASLRERYAARLADRLGDRPPLALVGDRWRWASAGEPEDAAVVVAASDFDLTRALMTRRSAAQLRGWTRRGDIEPYLPAFATLGDLPTADLTE